MKTLRQRLHGFLASRFPSLEGHNEEGLKDPQEIVNLTKNNNCICIGSGTNPATEILLCRLFGANPFDPSPENRAKIPFRFILPKTNDLVKNSAIAEPWRRRLGKKSGLGLYDNSAAALLIEVDWWPMEKYLPKIVDEGHDCGVVIVINRPFATKHNVKTIIIGGFSGIGTEGAAKALIRDFRHLQPLPSASHTLGVLDATFRKSLPDQDNRNLTGYRWKYLTGGRKKISPSKKQEPRVGQ